MQGVDLQCPEAVLRRTAALDTIRLRHSISLCVGRAVVGAPRAFTPPLQQRTKRREQQAADDQDDRAAETGRDLRKGHELHAVCRGKDRHIAGAAHIRHAQPRGDTGLDRIEADPLADDRRTEERTDAGDKAQDQIGNAEAFNDGVEAQVAQADTDEQCGRHAVSTLARSRVTNYATIAFMMSVE